MENTGEIKSEGSNILKMGSLSPQNTNQTTIQVVKARNVTSEWYSGQGSIIDGVSGWEVTQPEPIEPMDEEEEKFKTEFGDELSFLVEQCQMQEEVVQICRW